MPAGTPIPTRALLLCEDLGERLGAQRVGEAIAAGLLEAGAAQPDICALGRSIGPAGEVRELLDGLDFDTRMRAARAVVLAVGSLAEDTLAGSLAFEAATMARQAGIPCYAVTASNRLDAFDARILDLQAVLEASSMRALRMAGRRLAAIV
jgi:hypothetical protein